jgi:hypothetical protein
MVRLRVFWFGTLSVVLLCLTFLVVASFRQVRQAALNTRLIEAVKRGDWRNPDYQPVEDMAAVASALADGADPNARERQNGVSFWQRLRQFLRIEPRPKQSSRMSCPTALELAAGFAKFQIGQLLIDHGAKVEEHDVGEFAPLTCLMNCRAIAGSFHPDFVPFARVLLDRGANPNATGADGWSILRLSVSARDYELVKLLIERGADVNADRPETALDDAEETLRAWRTENDPQVRVTGSGNATRIVNLLRRAGGLTLNQRL